MRLRRVKISKDLEVTTTPVYVNDILSFMIENWEDMEQEEYERKLRTEFTQDDYIDLVNMLIVLDENNALITELCKKAFEEDKKDEK